MGIELPKDIRDMAIPLAMDARGTGASVSPAFEEADIRKAEREKVLEHDKLVHDLSQADGTGELNNAGVMDGAAGLRRDQIIAERKAEKDKDDVVETQMLLAALNERIAQLDIEIGQYEAIFEARFGDAWREEIAVRVLDEDEMPERQDGESMADYRQRVEDAIVEKIIDPETGKMRPEYKNHPEFKEYGEWAEREHEQRKMKAMAEKVPTASPEELAQMERDIREVHTTTENDQLEQSLSRLNPEDQNTQTVRKAVVEAGDNGSLEIDSKVDAGADNFFASFGSPS